MDTRATILLLFIVAYLLFANDSATQFRGSGSQASLESAVNEAQRLLHIVGNATYGEYDDIFHSTNSTGGFNHISEFAWTSLPKVQGRARQHVLYGLGESHGGALNSTQHALPQLYMNITGDARGQWLRSPIFDEGDIPRLNMSRYAPNGPLARVRHSRFDRNFTQSTGDVSIGLREKELSEESTQYDMLLGNITTIAADMVLSEDQGEQEEEISLRGIYFPKIGHAVLTTTSNKFAGLFALPLFSASPHTFDLSRILLNDTIARMIAKEDESSIAMINPWGSSLGEDVQSLNAAPKCELIVYLQQIPPAVFSEHQQSLAFLDKELRYPTGAPTGMAPRMHFSMLIFSPDCGYILESRGPPDVAVQDGDHLYGYKREALQARARHHMLMYGVIILLQLIALLRQMREANTPSTRGRVSFFTIAFMVFGDAFATIIFITISLFIESIWITIMSTAFFSLSSMLLFGMRFLSDIWAVHAPEHRRQEQEATERLRQRRQAAIASARERQQNLYSATSQQQQTTSAPAPVVQSPAEPPASTPAVNPIPVDFGSIPLFMPSDQAGLQAITDGTNTSVPTFGAIYVRFSFLLMMTLFVSISAITFPDTLRRMYFTLLSLIYLSFWLPQIWRNAWRNCRCALKWEFVAAQSILRLMPAAYFFGWEGNVLFTKPHLITLAILCTWVWLQVVMLISQELVGPRWFVKQAWVPPAWDYHPILQTDVEGFAMPLGLAETEIESPTSPHARRASRSSDRKSTSTHDAQSKRVFDCAICMQELEVPVVESSEMNSATSASFLLVRRTYMITPCRHIFHSKCLEGWMKYRMQCPNCREELPP